MFDDRFDITELERRVANLIRIGSIASVDHAAARATVALGDITTTALPWLTRRAGNDRDWWAPSTGEQVVVMSVGGDLAQGVILPALYSDTAPAPANDGTIHRTIYADGAVIEYDTAAQDLSATLPGSAVVTAGGDITVTSGGSVTITAPNVVINATQGGSGAAAMTGDFKLTGNFEITGDISVTGNVAASGSILDGGGNSNHHSH